MKNLKLKAIPYSELNARQKENFNYHKASAVLADYGFSTIRLNDDWQGADFLAIHINGKDILKVQLKGRFTLEKKYIGKDIWVCFQHKSKSNWFLYPHDEVLNILSTEMNFTNSDSWKNGGGYSWGRLTPLQLSLLQNYEIIEKIK